MDQAEAAEKIWKKAETFSKQEEIDSFMAVIYFVNCTLMQSCLHPVQRKKEKATRTVTETAAKKNMKER